MTKFFIFNYNRFFLKIKMSTQEESFNINAQSASRKPLLHWQICPTCRVGTRTGQSWGLLPETSADTGWRSCPWCLCLRAVPRCDASSLRSRMKCHNPDLTLQSLQAKNQSMQTEEWWTITNKQKDEPWTHPPNLNCTEMWVQRKNRCRVKDRRGCDQFLLRILFDFYCQPLRCVTWLVKFFTCCVNNCRALKNWKYPFLGSTSKLTKLFNTLIKNSFWNTKQGRCVSCENLLPEPHHQRHQKDQKHPTEVDQHTNINQSWKVSVFPHYFHVCMRNRLHQFWLACLFISVTC